MSPLIKELASIGSENSRNLSLKTLLPNAQFSSENETSGENCSFLISSGQNSNREQNEEKDMSVPLGQLNLEVVSMNNRQNQPTQSSTSTNVTFPSKNMKLNEIIINFHHKEKQYTPAAAVLEESKDESVIATAFHKMPPVVLSRKSGPKNVHPPKNTCTLSKKIDNIRQEGEVSVEQINRMADSNTENGDSNSSANIENILVDAAKSVDAGNSDIISNKKGLGIAGQPLITNVISLSSKTFEKDDFNEGETSQSSFPKISEVCSLSCNAEAKKIESTESRKIVINIQSKPDDSVVLKPPIIRVEDFAFDEELEQRNRTSVKKIVTDKPEKTLYKSKTKDSKNTETLDKSVESPEVIILEEEKTDRVVTVTIDSEDEKEVDTPAKSYSDAKVECSPVPPSSDDNTIRKEMEKLRNQIASETDCLLFDDTVTKTPLPEISLTIKPPENPEKSGLLSPIEEAICSLHKKLEEEGQKQKKEKSNENVSEKVEEIRTLPRTRSFTKGKAKKGEVGENVEKSDSDDSNTMSNVSAIEGSKKDKKFKEELSGKELYICGNEKCNFSAEGDLQLKVRA